MTHVPGLTSYMCRRQYRDNEEKLVSGKGEQNVKLVLNQISSDGKTLNMKRDLGNFREFGPSFSLKQTKLNKWMNAYKQWSIAQKPKASDAYPPFFVPSFAFHAEYINLEFTIVNIEEYMNEFRTSNKLRDLTEDESFEMVMKVYEPCSSGPHKTTTHEKWDKLREMIRKMTQNE